MPDRRYEDRESFEATCLACHERTITQDQFVRRTDARWRMLSQQLYQRWHRKLPAWVEVDDVLQVTRMLAIEFCGAWDPGNAKGGKIGPFVVWNTTKRTQRELHRWREAKLSGNEGRNPSRHEVALSRYCQGQVGDDMAAATDRMLDRLTCEPDAEEKACRDDQRLRRHARSLADAAVLEAICESEGSVAGAAQLIVESLSARLQCRVETVPAAAALVRSTMRRIARDLDLAEFVDPDDAGTRVPPEYPDASFDEMTEEVLRAIDAA